MERDTSFTIDAFCLQVEIEGLNLVLVHCNMSAIASASLPDLVELDVFKVLKFFLRVFILIIKRYYEIINIAFIFEPELFKIAIFFQMWYFSFIFKNKYFILSVRDSNKFREKGKIGRQTYCPILPGEPLPVPLQRTIF